MQRVVPGNNLVGGLTEYCSIILFCLLEGNLRKETTHGVSVGPEKIKKDVKLLEKFRQWFLK